MVSPELWEDGTGVMVKAKRPTPQARPAQVIPVTTAVLLAGLLTAQAADDTALRSVAQRLEQAQHVRIVCFGDSITGRYYHTGSRIAYPKLVEQALTDLYPRAKVEVINAGISGNSTPAGLQRMDRDVLAHKPHLVVVMYGMNDVCANKPDAFEANMRTIVKRTRDAGAAVMLCTQNNTYPAGPRRPPERLAQYTQIIRDVAAQTHAPLADCYAAYEAIQKRERLAWVMLMSETIHPNLNGHRVFAQCIVECLTGKRLPLEAFKNSHPAIPLTLSRIGPERPELRAVVVGLDPDTFAAAVHKALPKARLTVQSRTVADPSVAFMQKHGKTLFNPSGEHLLVIALPAEPLSEDFEAYKRHVFWIVRHSVAFGYSPRARDVVWVLPSVLNPALTPNVQEREKHMLALAHSHHVAAIARPKGKAGPAEDIIAAWLSVQASDTGGGAQ